MAMYLFQGNVVTVTIDEKQSEPVVNDTSTTTSSSTTATVTANEKATVYGTIVSPSPQNQVVRGKIEKTASWESMNSNDVESIYVFVKRILMYMLKFKLF